MHVWLDVMIIALIASTSLLISVRFILSAVYWLAFQSLVLSVLTLVFGLAAHQPELLWIASLTLLIKAMLIPLILRRALARIGLRRQAELALRRETLIGGVIAMWLIGYYVTPATPSLVGSHMFLSVAIGMLLSGVLVMITHQKAMMQGIGLIVIENGLFLAALSTSLGMPLLVDVGIFMDVFVVVLLIALLTVQIEELFASTNLARLRRLRG
ncbi:MAG: hypothetical protein OWU32_03640 [Firmicutes bacterium]|nr:hypothetical protein [Bacillota bacterium]